MAATSAPRRMALRESADDFCWILRHRRRVRRCPPPGWGGSAQSSRWAAGWGPECRDGEPGRQRSAEADAPEAAPSGDDASSVEWADDQGDPDVLHAQHAPGSLGGDQDGPGCPGSALDVQGAQVAQDAAGIPQHVGGAPPPYAVLRQPPVGPADGAAPPGDWAWRGTLLRVSAGARRTASARASGLQQPARGRSRAAAAACRWRTCWRSGGRGPPGSCRR